MTDVTQILRAIERGEQQASAELLPVVYNELRRLAAHKLSEQPAGQTLQPTALVHEAYLRLVDNEQAQHWNSRGHFFVAAAESMRRILIENIRRKQSLKRGGQMVRRDLDQADYLSPEREGDLLALDEALEKLAGTDPTAAKLVELKYFSGLTNAQAAEALDISRRSADRLWAFAKAWLLREMQG